MADIDTRISLTGESEWRRSIDACKASLAQFKAEQRLINEQYKENANSLEALVKKETVQSNIVKELTKEQGLYAQRLNEVKKALEEQQNKTADWNDKVQQQLIYQQRAKDLFGEQSEAYKGVTEKLQYYQAMLEASVEAEKNWDIQVSKATTDYNNLERQINANTIELDKMRNSIQALSDPMHSFQWDSRGITDEMKAMVQVIQDKVNVAYEQLVEVLGDCIKASTAYESAMAKVQKTTGMTDGEIERFSNKVKDLSTTIPITTEELAKIAETAGQLGIASSDLTQFTDTMARMGASTNMTAEAAATALAQVASVTGMSADEYSRLASSIVAVGNKFATTESNVANFVQRIAGAATNVKMTESEMVGLATAVTSLGIATDAGSTSIQSLIQKMETAVATGNNLEAWADVMGMSTEELAELWGNDATKALQVLISSLGNLDESMATTLATLGIGETRIIRTVATLANAEASTGLLTRALDTANTAWEENSALQLESQKQFETTEAKVAMFENAVNNLKVAIGDELTPVLGFAAQEGSHALEFITEFIEKNPEVVTAVTALTAALGAFVGAVGFSLPAITTAVESLTTAVSLAINPWTAVVAVVAAAGAAYLKCKADAESYAAVSKELQIQTEKTIKSTDKAIESIRDERNVIYGVVETVEELLEVQDRSAEQTLVLNSMIDKLNGAMPELNVKLNSAGTALVDISTGATVSATSLSRMAEAMAKEAVQEEKLNALKQLYIDKINYEEQLAKQKEQLTVAQEKYNEAAANGDIKMITYNSEVKGLEKSIKLLEQGLEDTVDAINDYSVGIDEATEGNGAYWNSIDYILQEQKKLQNDLKKLDEAFYEAGNAAKVKIEGEVGGAFDFAAKASTMSYDTIMYNLQSQLDFYTNYADNMENLNARTVDGMTEMLQKMQEDGELTADMVATLAGKTDEELAKIVEAWEAVQSQQWRVANGQADLELQYTKSTAKMKEGLYDLKVALNNVKGTYTATVQINYTSNGTLPAQSKFSSTPTLKFAQGWEYIPYDDFAAMLHEGEMVLTKAEARAYRESRLHGQSVVNNNNNRNYGGVTLNVYAQQGQDVDSLADEIMYRIDDATKRKEAVWA